MQVLAASAVFSLAACTSDPAPPPDEAPPDSTTQTTAASPPASTARPQTPASPSTPSTSPAHTPPRPTQQPASDHPRREGDPVHARVQRMSLRDRARQLMVVGFSGTTAPSKLIKTLHPGGLIYFSENARSTPQIAAMSRQAQRAARAAGQPLLLMTDQEGGIVTRLPGTSAVPAGIELGGNGPYARRTALQTGRDLVAVGVNVDLAPVSDVNTVGSRGVIGPRSFSSDPGVVSRMVRAQICGYHDGGVAAAAKHWPGHGSTTTDSHLSTASINASLRRWRSTDLLPFARAVKTDVDMILVGHLAFGRLDITGRPATISPRLTRNVLRRDLGYDGVIITDALNMGGITSWGSPRSIAVRSVLAGVDLLLMPPQPRQAVSGIVAAVRTGRISVGRLDASVERVLRLKRRLGLYRAPKRLATC